MRATSSASSGTTAPATTTVPEYIAGEATLGVAVGVGVAVGGIGVAVGVGKIGVGVGVGRIGVGVGVGTGRFGKVRLNLFFRHGTPFATNLSVSSARTMLPSSLKLTVWFRY